MSSRFCFVFVVFYFAAVAVLAIHLRNIDHRTFYKLCVQKAQHNRLKQELGNKQLRLESLINPAAVSQRLDA